MVHSKSATVWTFTAEGDGSPLASLALHVFWLVLAAFVPLTYLYLHFRPSSIGRNYTVLDLIFFAPTSAACGWIVICMLCIPWKWYNARYIFDREKRTLTITSQRCYGEPKERAEVIAIEDLQISSVRQGWVNESVATYVTLADGRILNPFGQFWDEESDDGPTQERKRQTTAKTSAALQAFLGIAQVTP